MNKINIAVLALTALTFSACADLSYNESSTRDEEWTYDSPLQGVKNLVWDVYAQVPSELKSNESGAFLASATDEAEFANTLSSIHNYYNGAWSPSQPFSNTWVNSYRAIAQIHMYMERIDKIDLSPYQYDPNYPTYVQQFELFPYELRFLRALFYFELVRTYGDVPLVTTTLTNAQANNVKRTPASEIFKFIEEECDAVAEYLPVTYMDVPGQEVGRATRGAVMGLKARALLYAASPLFNPENNKELWRKAAEANKYMIDHAGLWGYSLSNYANLWGYDSFYNKEFIFAIGSTEANDIERANYPIGVEGGNSGNCPSQSLVDAYEYQATGKTFAETNPGTINLATTDPYKGLDPRFALTVVKNGDSWPANSVQAITIETFNGGFNGAPKRLATPTGYYLRKLLDGNCKTTVNEPSNSRHTWSYMRLAEFYLNYAEAVYNYTGDATSSSEFGMSANDAVNVLRSRPDINMPLFEGNAGFEERYMRERMVEFAFEGMRFWDVRRWKKGKDFFSKVAVANISADLTLTRTVKTRLWDDKYNLYPIPQAELNKNGNLVQNPGW